MNGSAYNKYYIELMVDVVFVTVLHEHRRIIKHAIDKIKTWRGPKIEHSHVTAMFFNIL